MSKRCMRILVVWVSSVVLCRCSKVSARFVQHVLHALFVVVVFEAVWGLDHISHNVLAVGISHCGGRCRSWFFGQQVRRRKGECNI